MSHDFLRISQYFGIPPKLYKKSEAVVRSVRGESERQQLREGSVNRRRATTE